MYELFFLLIGILENIYALISSVLTRKDFAVIINIKIDTENF